jgi:gas vesicle protein
MGQDGRVEELREQGIGDLVKELSSQVSTLVRQEVELAKAEVGEKGKKAGVGAGMFGGAGVAAVLMLGSLTAFLILGMRVVSAVSGTKESVASTVADATPDGQQVKAAARRTKGLAEENPLAAIAGAAIGFVAGLFTPSTRMEDRRLGPMADQVKQSAAEASHEAVEHGKEVAKAAAQSAAHTAGEQARDHGEELQSSLQQKVQEATPSQS